MRILALSVMKVIIVKSSESMPGMLHAPIQFLLQVLGPNNKYSAVLHLCDTCSKRNGVGSYPGPNWICPIPALAS